MKEKYDLIIFDLDGTLLDTSQGIYNSVRYAEEKMGFPKVPEFRLPEFVGPPPKFMYQKVYNVSEEIALQAAKYHREYGREKAIYEAKTYPGIRELLETIKKRGYNLAIATLKSQSIAEHIIAIHNLSSYFDCVVGMDVNESLSKNDTIRIAMGKTNSKHVVLVGDSIYDYEGAQEASVDFIGVLYGFGLKSEPRVFPTIQHPKDLLEFI